MKKIQKNNIIVLFFEGIVQEIELLSCYDMEKK